MQALDETPGLEKPSVILQAVAFGLLHIEGVPGKWIYIFTAMICGVMLSVIRHPRGNLRAVCYVYRHRFAIFVILVLMVR